PLIIGATWLTGQPGSDTGPMAATTQPSQTVSPDQSENTEVATSLAAALRQQTAIATFAAITMPDTQAQKHAANGAKPSHNQQPKESPAAFAPTTSNSKTDDDWIRIEIRRGD